MSAHTLSKTADRQRGFTLPELLISTAITSVVMSQIVVALITSQRLFEATVADLELSLQSRALREKILFDVNVEDGGLMNVSQSELSVEDKNTGNGWGKGLKFKPAKGAANRLALGTNKKLKADRGAEAWLARGPATLESEDVFKLVSSNGTILVNMDLVISISNRKYGQQHQAKSQIMNE